MQGSLQRLVDMFTGDDTCLVIPVYQRNYDWKQENCARLFDDLVATVKEERPNHFFGAIVYKDEGQIGESTIIDGQQRLTTVNLLFLALHHELTQGQIGPDERLAQRIQEGYLESKYSASGQKLKLKHVKADADAYAKLFGPSQYFDATSNVTANYRYFADRLRAKELTPQEMFDAIRRLQVMRLKLEESDDAQLIFESLNSTGLDLSEADMIRNYILMGQDRPTQERLYNDYWNRIEVDVDYGTSAFIRHYLTAKLGRSPKVSELYMEFKGYLRNGAPELPEVLSEMRDYAAHSRAIKNSQLGSVSLDRLMRRFNLVDREVTLPFLLPTVDDLRRGVLPPGEVYRVVSAVDSYLARRWVCGYPTNSLNKIFALLYREARKLTDERNSFADVVIHLLTRRQGSGTFPTDQEFADSLATKDFYHVSASLRNYFWESLENGTSNDTRDIASALAQGNVSIEHVMPQTLNSEWIEALGPDHQRVHSTWLHRLANLTVTGYNAMYSNAPFETKRDRERGFRDTPYRINKLLQESQVWTEAELEQRGEALAALALEYWRTPESSYQPPADSRDVESMGEDTDFTGRELKAWEYLGSTHAVVSWKQMLVEVLGLLAEQHLAGLHRYATGARDTNMRVRTGESTEKLDGMVAFAPGMEVSTWSSTGWKMWILRDVFHSLGIDTDELVFHMTPQAEEQTT